MAGMVRVGIGYDIHRLVSDRPLVLGGVRIEHDRGLLGHSDGDVVLHAVTDALLGAAGMGDIGELYPDTDPANKDSHSRRFVIDVMVKLRSAGLAVGNVDVIVHAERPNLSEYKAAIRESLAELTAVSLDRVNVKAKTAEGLGPVGVREAMACSVAVTIGEATDGSTH